MTMPSPPGGYGPPAPHAAPTAGGAPPAGMAPGPAPAIPPPPRREPKSKAAGIALGGVVTLLVAGGGATGVLLCTGGKKLDTRIALEKAPPVTVAVMAGPAHGDLAPADAATKEATASALASRFCGGLDIVGELFAARYRDAEAAVAPLAPLRDPIALTDALKCGKSLADAMEGRSVVQLGVLDGQQPRRVAALRHKAPLGPFVGFIDRSFGSLLGRCTPPKPGDKPAGDSPCGENGAAGFEEGGVYFGGRPGDVSFFASAYRSAGDGAREADPSGALATLAKKLDPADSWELRFHPEAIDLALPCVAAAPADGVAEMLKLCLPAGHEADGAALAGDVKAAAVARDRPEHGKSVGFEYVLLARDSAAAKSAVTKLEAYTAAWSKTVAQNEAAILKVVAAGKDPRDAVFRAAARTWMEAIKTPVVGSSGDVVRLSFRKDLFEDDRAQVKALTLSVSEDVQKAGEVVSAVLEAKPPPAEVLAHFLGPDLASWLLAADATVQDCRAIAKHANDLSNAPDFPNDQFLPMTELIETWGGAVPENEKDEIKIDEKACTGRRLPAEAKACLLAAKGIAEMNRCPVPVSPATATFRARIQGKWRTSAAAGGGGDSLRAQGPDRSGASTLVVEGGKAELSGSYDSMKGDLGFVYVRLQPAPELGGEATVARMKIGPRRAELTFAGDKLYLATYDAQSGKKKPQVLLERVTGD